MDAHRGQQDHEDGGGGDGLLSHDGSRDDGTGRERGGFRGHCRFRSGKDFRPNGGETDRSGDSREGDGGKRGGQTLAKHLQPAVNANANGPGRDPQAIGDRSSAGAFPEMRSKNVPVVGREGGQRRVQRRADLPRLGRGDRIGRRSRGQSIRVRRPGPLSSDQPGLTRKDADQPRHDPSRPIPAVGAFDRGEEGRLHDVFGLDDVRDEMSRDPEQLRRRGVEDPGQRGGVSAPGELREPAIDRSIPHHPALITREGECYTATSITSRRPRTRRGSDRTSGSEVRCCSSSWSPGRKDRLWA